MRRLQHDYKPYSNPLSQPLCGCQQEPMWLRIDSIKQSPGLFDPKGGAEKALRLSFGRRTTLLPPPSGEVAPPKAVTEGVTSWSAVPCNSPFLYYFLIKTFHMFLFPWAMPMAAARMCGEESRSISNPASLWLATHGRFCRGRLKCF